MQSNRFQVAKNSLRITSAVALALGVPVAVAQGQEPSAAESRTSGLEEIVVTANRREENIQSVPVAITAFDAERLREHNIRSATDIMGKVPSLMVTSAGTQRNAEVVVIRGQGQTYLASVGVVNYFAEVPLIQGSVIANQGGPGSFFDLESLQVLRGPQGTLFGRNTTGGAVLLGPKKPTNELEGYVQAQFGNYSDQEFEAALNVPVIDDRLLMRAAFIHVERDGFTKDIGPAAYGYSDVCTPSPFSCFGPRSPGFAGKDYDNKDYWHARLGVTFRPTDRIENYLLAYYGDSKDNGTGFVIDGIDPGFPVAPGVSISPNVATIASNLAYMRPFDPAAILDPTIAQAVLARQNQIGPRKVAMNIDQFMDLETWGVINTFGFEITDTLTLRNIVSYQRMEQSYGWDLDGSILPILSQQPAFVAPGVPVGNVGDEVMFTNLSQVTAELQLLGEALDGQLEYAVGGFYSNSEPEGLQAMGSFNAAELNPGSFFDIENRNTAVYAQATLDLGTFTPALDQWSVTGGLRYTEDRLLASRYAGNFFVIPVVNDAEVESSATTWTAGLDYQATEDVLLYGKVSRGYKAGGFNAFAPRPAGLVYKPEFVTNYELGAKTDLLLGDMPLRFNVNAYYLDYEDIQRASADNYPNNLPDGSCPNATCLDQGAITFNAEGARIQGVEIEATLRPMEDLEISAGYSFTDAEYTDFMMNVAPDPLVRSLDTCDGPLAVPFPGQPATTADMSCIPFQNVPENMFNLSGRYTVPLGDAGSLAFAAVYSWVDEIYSSPASTPNDDVLAWLDSYGLLNLSIDWSGVFGSNLDARLWSTNVTDETYRINGYAGLRQASGFVNSVYGEPRMYGISLRYSFGK